MNCKLSTKVLLIGGTSHVGKSTLAKHLSASWGWQHLSTDQLARHPGRPWRQDRTQLSSDVTNHYSTLTADELIDSVCEHYRANVWPIISALVRSHLNNSFEPCLVLEGSAILPELAFEAGFDRTRCIWLTAPDDLIAERIRKSSDFDGRSADERKLIEAFLERTLVFNRMIADSSGDLADQFLDVTAPNFYDSLLHPLGGL